MLEVSFLSALFGGILTFLAPCTLPLIPGYIAFIGGGTSLSGELRRRMFLNAVLFVVGFSLVFILYGVASGALGKFITLYRKEIAQAGGVIIVILGLFTLDIFSLPNLRFGGSWRLPKSIGAGSRSGAFLLGFLFALGWSPCLGPILGTILVLAGTTGTALSGGLLLGVYSLGLALPFLFIAYFYGTALSYLPRLARYLPMVQKLGGVVIILIGLLLVVGQFGILNTWASALLGPRLFDAMAQYM